jgi:hypothetical protein
MHPDRLRFVGGIIVTVGATSGNAAVSQAATGGDQMAQTLTVSLAAPTGAVYWPLGRPVGPISGTMDPAVADQTNVGFS